MDKRCGFAVIDGPNVCGKSHDIALGSCASGPPNGVGQGRNQLESSHPAKPPSLMPPGRIVLPINLANCPLEAFSFVNKFAGHRRVEVILVHVVNLNVP